MELSPRLRSVAGLVPPGARFADVGTDHAYLPVWLLQQGIIEHALVSDLRPVRWTEPEAPPPGTVWRSGWNSACVTVFPALRQPRRIPLP